jgi:hypothetical protein
LKDTVKILRDLSPLKRENWYVFTIFKESHRTIFKS